MGNRVSSKWNRKRLVIAIFLLLIPNLLFSFELEILPEQPTVGRVITLKIITDIPQDSDIQVDDLELPYDIKEIAGPVVRTYRVLEDRRYKRYYQVTWALRVDKSGIYSIPKFNVVVNGKDNELEFPTLIVLNNDERFNNYPINVEWNRSVKKEIYVGESIPLILEAYNLEEIYFPDRKVHIYPEKGEVAEETVAGIDLYRVPMASWIYTPLEVGNVYIPPVRVEINGLIRFTEALDITVLPIRYYGFTNPGNKYNKGCW
ncbi:MAG: hypothetical protein B6229_07525 [Spirochaetaceae bacterium 4572_7]|nr:MAG: hypothetical protein B6229_07525 [Spirochaetaceae bacterium 4572_7]